MSDLVRQIHAEWAEETGALFKFRYAEFDLEGFLRLNSILERIDFGNASLIDHDLVSIIWDIPLFLHLLKSINIEKNPAKTADINRAAEMIHNQVSRIFYFRDDFGKHWDAG